MRALKTQFFLAFAVMGAFLPYFPKVLLDRGLSDTQIGFVQGLYGVAVLLSPMALTALADLRLGRRRLLIGCFLVAGLMCVALARAHTFWALALAYLGMALAFVPLVPLQDGLTFSAQAEQRRRGEDETPYHRVRVWGTLGFLVPAFGLYVLLSADSDLGVTMLLAAGICGLGVINAATLPPAEEEESTRRPQDAPTLQAVKTLLHGRLFGYVLGMWLLASGVFAYYLFYPLYLSETIGIDLEWLGLIVGAGVVVEVFWMLGFGRLKQRFGLRTLAIVGGAVVMLRMALLAAFPNLGVALATQLLHGPMVLVIHVVPPILLNQSADDATRHSLQGVYLTLVLGTARIVGVAVAGLIADAWSYPAVFTAAAGASALATVLFIWAMRPGDDTPGAQ